MPPLTTRLALAALLAPLALACATDGTNGTAAPARGERAASARQAILAGEPEPAALAVAVFTRPVPSLTVCSGVLVAANVVLTARHCVAALTAPSGRSFCGPTGVRGGAARPASSLGVTTDAEVTDRSVRRSVKRVHLLPDEAPEGDVALCGADLALLELDAPLDVPPLVPRLDEPPQVGEPLRVLGYGRDGRDAARSGTRQTSQPTPVLGLGGVVGDDGTVFLDPREVLLGPAACDGDSGGPLLDAARRVVAIVSHGKTVDDEATCGEGGHTRVDAHAAWLRATVREAATDAGLEAPAWSLGGGGGGADADEPSDAGTTAAARPASDAAVAAVADDDATSASEGGCGLARGGSRPLSPCALGVLLLGGAFARASRARRRAQPVRSPRSTARR